jgi:hypothetical protein
LAERHLTDIDLADIDLADRQLADRHLDNRHFAETVLTTSLSRQVSLKLCRPNVSQPNVLPEGVVARKRQKIFSEITSF